MKICREIPNLFKIGQISDTLHEDLSMFYCCRRHKFSIKALLYNNQYFGIVDSNLHLYSTHRRHCCVSVAKLVKRMRRNLTLYVHCLSRFYVDTPLHVQLKKSS